MSAHVATLSSSEAVSEAVMERFKAELDEMVPEDMRRNPWAMAFIVIVTRVALLLRKAPSTFHGINLTPNA